MCILDIAVELWTDTVIIYEIRISWTKWGNREAIYFRYICFVIYLYIIYDTSDLLHTKLCCFSTNTKLHGTYQGWIPSMWFHISVYWYMDHFTYQHVSSPDRPIPEHLQRHAHYCQSHICTGKITYVWKQPIKHSSTKQINANYVCIKFTFTSVTDMGFWSTTQHRWFLIRINGLPEPWRVPPDSWHDHVTLTIQYSFIHMESISCELALKPSLYNNSPIHSKYFRPGNTRLPRTFSLARGNTHFPRTWCFARGKHPHSAHLNLARSQHPRRPQGFGNLPISRPGLGKLPTRQSMSSLWSPYCLILMTQLGRVSPYWLWGLASTFRTLTNAVWDLPKQAHKSLYLQHRPLVLLFRASDLTPSFWNNTNHLIRSLIIKLYRFPSIRRTICITSLHDNHTIGPFKNTRQTPRKLPAHPLCALYW